MTWQGKARVWGPGCESNENKRQMKSNQPTDQKQAPNVVPLHGWRDHANTPMVPEVLPQVFPPGLVGEIAQFIYDAAPYPFFECALFGAHGFMVGICGRTFNVREAGLNSYLILLADTGSGKDAYKTAIAKLVKAVAVSVPSVRDFVGPTYHASGQAILKSLAEQNCQFSIQGEIGHTLKAICDPRAQSHNATKLRALLDLYHASGKSGSTGGLHYSDKKENVSSTKSPSFTIMGESTALTVFENISLETVSIGLLPRFDIYQYKLPRPYPNENPLLEPPEWLVRKLVELVVYVASASSRPDAAQVSDVGFTNEAEAIFKRFRYFADDKVRKGDEIAKQMWNRAHIKAMKYAASIAIGQNYISPVIDVSAAHYAINQVSAQTQAVIEKFECGEVGSPDENEALRERCVIDEIAAYCRSEYNLKKYVGTTRKMHESRVITERYLQQRFASKACFKNARIGQTSALKKTLENMCRNGLLKHGSPHSTKTLFQKASQTYQVADSKSFGLELMVFENMFDDASYKEDN